MLYYAQGDAIVTSDELLEPKTLDSISNLTDFVRFNASGPAPDPIRLSTGAVDATSVQQGFDPGDGQPVPWVPIGPGRPLTVMIRQVYTGNYPRSGLFGGRKDLLVSSAVKSITAFDAQPRAINFLTPKQASNSRLDRPKASQKGTPLVFYSPALLEKSLTLDLTLVFDTFPQQVFDKVGSAFQSAGSIPIFLSYSVYLLAAGALAKLVGAAGEAIFDGKPVFDASAPLDIYLPGRPPLPAGFALVVDGNADSLEPDFRAKYHVAASGQVVDKTGKLYAGDIPYIVISYDGTADEKLASFAPTAATAAVLSRFFGIKDNEALPFDLVIDAIRLYNDFKHRQEADRLDDQIKKLPVGDAKRKQLEETRAAVQENILEELLRPKPAAAPPPTPTVAGPPAVAPPPATPAPPAPPAPPAGPAAPPTG